MRSRIMWVFMIMLVCMIMFMNVAGVVRDAGMGLRMVGPRRVFMGIAVLGWALGRVSDLHGRIIGAAAGVTHGRLPPLP